jgi:hypothetical protein
LPRKTRIYPNINISKLKKYYGDVPKLDPFPSINEDQEEYEVEEIRGERNGEFLVK